MGNKTRDWDGIIVLVADPSDETEMSGAFDRRIDRPAKATVAALANALEACCERLILISDLNELTDRLGRLSRSLIFPYWFGQVSRSRHGLVPALCEANEVMFVGADAFAKIICNDKELSKAICRQSKLLVPTSAVVTSVQDLQYAKFIKLPVIVKPNYEGTSLGISEENRCETWDAVSEVSGRLISELGQPLILEEFISGREFSACFLAQPNAEPMISIGAWSIEGQDDYLDDKVNSWELKRDVDLAMDFKALDGQFRGEDLFAMRDCFTRLSSPGLLRIDGRLTANGPVIIELTPDIYLGPDGEFSQAFLPTFGSFEALISTVIHNCLEGYGANMPVR